MSRDHTHKGEKYETCDLCGFDYRISETSINSAGLRVCSNHDVDVGDYKFAPRHPYDINMPVLYDKDLNEYFQLGSENGLLVANPIGHLGGFLPFEYIVADWDRGIYHQLYMSNGEASIKEGTYGRKFPLIPDSSGVSYQLKVISQPSSYSSLQVDPVENFTLGIDSVEHAVSVTLDDNVHSTESFTGGCSVSFTPGQTTSAFYMGLNQEVGIGSIDYLWQLRSDGQARPYIETAPIDPLYTYTTDSVFSIVYDGGDIYFYIDGILKHTETIGLNKTFYLEGIFDTTLTTVNDITFESTKEYTSFLNLIEIAGGPTPTDAILLDDGSPALYDDGSFITWG